MASGAKKQSVLPLKQLKFQDTFTAELPADTHTPRGPAPIKEASSNYSRIVDGSNKFHNPFTQSGSVEDLKCPFPDNVVRTSRLVRQAAFTFLYPESTGSPFLLHHSPESLNLLGIENVTREEEKVQYFERIFSGKEQLPDSKPWCSIYGGHQYGFYAGQLGDGRAISLGEIVPASGQRWELQLKGCGRTTYSRFGDGYCTLTAAVREYVASELMSALGIPTTRAVCVVGSDRYVQRDLAELGAIVTRASPSWIRFGTFELFWYRGEKKLLRDLADYTIKYHFPSVHTYAPLTQTVLQPTPLSDAPRKLDLHNSRKAPHERANMMAKNKAMSKLIKPDRTIDLKVPLNRYAKFLQDIVRKTAIMIAHWQADNMSILGLTLDYGPFGFLESYDPTVVFNTSDVQGRYSFENQPKVGLWNLSKLARCFVELVTLPITDTGKDIPILPTLPQGYSVSGLDVVREILKSYETIFLDTFTELMRKKLGLKLALKEDLDTLILPLLQLMADAGVDYTTFFRALCDFRINENEFHLHVNEGGETLRKGKVLVPKTCRTLLLEAMKRAIDNKYIPPKTVTESNMQATLSGASGIKIELDSSALVASRRSSQKQETLAVEDQEGKPDSRRSSTIEPTKIEAMKTNKSKSRLDLSDTLFPTVEEIAQRWTEWAGVYRRRLEEDMESYQPGSTKEFIDSVRSETMRRVNPKYVLRNCLLDELCKHVNMTLSQCYPPPPTATPSFPFSSTQNSFKSHITEKQVKESVKEKLDRFMRVLVSDVYGDVADARGWDKSEDKEAGNKWFQHNPECALNSTTKCL